MRNDSCSTDSQQPALLDTVMDNGGHPRIRNQRAAEVHGPSILSGTLSSEGFYRHLAYSQSLLGRGDQHVYHHVGASEYILEDTEPVVVKTEPGLEYNKENQHIQLGEEVGKCVENNNMKHPREKHPSRMMRQHGKRSRNNNKKTLKMSQGESVPSIKLIQRTIEKKNVVQLKKKKRKPSKTISMKLRNCKTTVKCAQCTRTYVSAYHCQVHKAKNHSVSLRKHACNNCERLFITKGTAKYHRKYACK